MVSAIGSSSFPSLVAVPNAALWGHASVSIALQLFSMRRLGSIDAQLEASRNAGFKIVECLQIHIHEPSIFRTMLDVRGLECTTLHVEYQFLIDNAGSILDACLIVGFEASSCTICEFKRCGTLLNGHERDLVSGFWQNDFLAAASNLASIMVETASTFSNLAVRRSKNCFAPTIVVC